MLLLATPSFNRITPPFTEILELSLPHPNTLFSEHGQGGLASEEQSFPQTSK